MRIDHDGEGGILALLARADPPKIFGVPMRPDWLLWVAVVGGAMIIGDGMITPAISVLSAVEGTSGCYARRTRFHRSDLSRNLARAIRHSVARNSKRRIHVRSDHDRMVCCHCRQRPTSRRRASRDPFGAQSTAGNLVRHASRNLRLSDLRRDRSGNDRRRSPLCRHVALRPHPHHHCVVCFRVSRAHYQLCRTGCGRRRRP